jgi:hypothetical protein
MRTALVCLLLLAAPALAQPPLPTDPSSRRPCPDCGVIRSIRSVVKSEPPPPGDAAKPSGLVATVPLKGGKVQVGPSQKLGRDVAPTSTTYEVIVRYDDGRFTALVIGDRGEWKEGDRVRVEKGRLLPR